MALSDGLSVTIGGIEFHGFHGVYEEEARLGNRFRVELEYEGAFLDAVGSDRLEDTVDYDAVVACIHDVNRRSRYNLIESFAGNIVDEILTRFPRISRITVRVTKIAPGSLGSEAWTTAEIRRTRP